MKYVNPAVVNAIRTGYDVHAVPRLTVEWNYNRYTDVVVDNTPSEDTDGQDIELFPIESLAEANRPTAGIIKARVGEARISPSYSTHDGVTRRARYYIGSDEDVYKYWSSPVQTNGSGVFPLHTDSYTMVRPHVDYPNGVRANRIVIGFEDTWSSPKDFTVRVKTSPNGTYDAVSTNPTLNAQGQVVLNYGYSAPQKWFAGNAPENDPALLPVIYGIEVRVDSLRGGIEGGSVSGANSYLSLIEISARRVHDLTDRLVSVSDTFDLGEKSLIYPLGTLTSNSGQVTLFNGDGVFNSESGSLYAELMEPNAVFNLEYMYTVNGATYPVQQFKMYCDAWSGQRAESVSLDLADFSKYFQETKPRATSYENLTAAEIVWRICDSIGFVDYEIQRDDFDADFTIPIWWCDGEQTVWEVFDELSKASQTAIYFDGFGKLQVRTRAAAFKTTVSPDWTLRGENAGTELADIITLDQTDELESNFIKVTYQQTDIDPIVNGQSKTQILWQPEGTAALRACALLNDLSKDATVIPLPPQEAKIWPFTGMVNIQGEFIKYVGKRFVYFTYTETIINDASTGYQNKVIYSNEQRHEKAVESNDDYKALNESTPFEFRYKNHWTGELAITERGVWNSENKDHSVDADGYSIRSIINGTHRVGVNGFSHHKSESRVYLNTVPKSNDESDFLVATRGNEWDTGFMYYGVRMRFEKDADSKTQQAGVVIHNNGAGEDGYYFELTPTSQLNDGKTRAKRNEMVMYTRSGGTWKMRGKGKPLSIIEDVDYDLDIQFKVNGSDHEVTVWVNGKKCFTEVITPVTQSAANGKFGLFARGDSKVSYEFLYAVNQQGDTEPTDDFSYLDKILGGYTGGQLDREWVYQFRTKRRRVKKKWKKVQYKYNIAFFDEFGPIVHEIREFDVKFDPKPAIASRLYLANDWSAICPEYRADAFSAHFYVANTSRQTCIVHGEDNLTYAGSSAPINPVMTVIGRSVTLAEAETVEAKNEEQIRRRGEIQTEISSTWVQTKEMAEQLADWIKGHWSVSADEQQVTIFGNPLIELGDIMAFEYPVMDMTAATHQYFVTGVNNSFDSGLETQVTLRRRVV